MLKVTIPKIGFMLFMLVFCLHLSGLTVANECWNREGGGPTVTGNYTYPPFQYDPDNPDEIDRNNSIPICVIGGIPPYTWQVSGNGFSLSEGATKGLTNTLYANDTACGTATITVIDNCGNSCTGKVRCTTGAWTTWTKKEEITIYKSDVCPEYPNCKTSGDLYDTEVCSGTSDWYKWNLKTTVSSSGQHCPPTVYDNCGRPRYWDTAGACNLGTVSLGGCSVEIDSSWCGSCGCCYAVFTWYERDWVCP